MSGKRILLMYITEVSGHHSATLALEKAIKRISHDVEILNINAFHYTNPRSEKIINRMYIAVIKHLPGLWKYLYNNPKVVKRLSRIKEAIHRFNSPKLEKLFNNFKPDVIVCSQAFPCGMVADFKKEHNFSVPLVGVLTDFVPHAYWFYDQVDYYIAPSEDIGVKLVEKGVSPDKIKPLGIPIDPKFGEPVAKKEVLQRLGLEEGVFTILIMGGGQGLGPIKNIISYLDKISYPVQEIIVCGSNKKLYNCLKRKTKRYKKKIVLLGYANNINELMAASNVLITKPGGITTAEALAKNMPMIIINPIPGQEASNTAYLIEKKAAIKVDTASAIASCIVDLIKNPERLRELSLNAKNISKPNSSLDIAQLALALSAE